MDNKRVERLREKMEEFKVDAFLVFNFYNILYLTGFKTLTVHEREAFVLVTKDNIYLFFDKRYEIRNPNGIQIKYISPERGLISYLQEIIKSESIASLGFEGDEVKYYEYEKLKAFLNISLISLEQLIIRIREEKDTDEISKIKKACQIGDQCLTEIKNIIKNGITEKEIAFKIEFWLKEKGYDIAFDPIVAVDKNSAIPHYNTKNGEGTVKGNSVILIDFGVKYKDYCSDITRIFFAGQPTEMINVYQNLLEVQQSTIGQLGKENNLRSIDSYCRKLLTEKDLIPHQHSTGHGVGLEVHEYPKISQSSLDFVKSGQVLTVEPAVYLPNRWGIRIEDTVYIKSQNKIEVLTNSAT